MKILVTGANGQLGSELKKISKQYEYNWKFTSKIEFDFLNTESISIVLDNIKPNFIINCAAYTLVDQAEIHKKKANTINHLALELISKWCHENYCKLIHISSDFVYDGSSSIPIKENQKEIPINNYGKTKLKGEIACLSNCPDSIIIRTSWLYSSFGNNFVKKIINLSKRNSKINVVKDQIGSPTYAGDLAEVIMKIIINKHWVSGVFNFSNDGAISRYDFANDIKMIYSFSNHINPLANGEYFEKIKRPKYTVLDNTKIKNTYNISLVPYLESLKKCIKIIKNAK